MMALASEVIRALRSWQTIFVCKCGGMLWHFDDDGEIPEELRCDRCSGHMALAPKIQATVDYYEQRQIPGLTVTIDCAEATA